MFEKFTDEARAALVRADNLGRARQDQAISSAVLLLGLLGCRSPSRSRFVATIVRHGGSAAAIEAIEEAAAAFGLETSESVVDKPVAGPAGRMPYTRACFTILERSIQLAQERRAEHVGTYHLLLAMLSLPDSLACRLLAAHGVTLERVESAPCSGNLRDLLGAYTYLLTQFGPDSREELAYIEERRSNADFMICADIAKDLHKAVNQGKAAATRIGSKPSATFYEEANRLATNCHHDILAQIPEARSVITVIDYRGQLNDSRIPQGVFTAGQSPIPPDAEIGMLMVLFKTLAERLDAARRLAQLTKIDLTKTLEKLAESAKTERTFHGTNRTDDPPATVGIEGDSKAAASLDNLGDSEAAADA